MNIEIWIFATACILIGGGLIWRSIWKTRIIGAERLLWLVMGVMMIGVGVTNIFR